MVLNPGSSLNAMMTLKNYAFGTTQSSQKQKSKSDTQNSTTNSSPEEEYEEHKKLLSRSEKLTECLHFYLGKTLSSYIVLSAYFIFQEIPPPPILLSIK